MAIVNFNNTAAHINRQQLALAHAFPLVATVKNDNCDGVVQLLGVSLVEHDQRGSSGASKSGVDNFAPGHFRLSTDKKRLLIR